MEVYAGGKYLGEIHVAQESVNCYSYIGKCPT